MTDSHFVSSARIAALGTACTMLVVMPVGGQDLDKAAAEELRVATHHLLHELVRLSVRGVEKSSISACLPRPQPKPDPTPRQPVDAKMLELSFMALRTINEDLMARRDTRFNAAPPIACHPAK